VRGGSNAVLRLHPHPPTLTGAVTAAGSALAALDPVVFSAADPLAAGSSSSSASASASSPSASASAAVSSSSASAIVSASAWLLPCATSPSVIAFVALAAGADVTDAAGSSASACWRWRFAFRFTRSRFRFCCFSVADAAAPPTRLRYRNIVATVSARRWYPSLHHTGERT